jgi:hypothetical protein
LHPGYVEGKAWKGGKAGGKAGELHPQLSLQHPCFLSRYMDATNESYNQDPPLSIHPKKLYLYLGALLCSRIPKYSTATLKFWCSIESASMCGVRTYLQTALCSVKILIFLLEILLSSEYEYCPGAVFFSLLIYILNLQLEKTLSSILHHN